MRFLIQKGFEKSPVLSLILSQNPLLAYPFCEAMIPPIGVCTYAR